MSTRNVLKAALDRVKSVHSANRGGSLYNEDVILVVLKYTQLDSASKALNWYCTTGSRNSTHVLVDRDGSATQLIGLNSVAWHVPRGSQWEGFTNLSRRSVGVALDNLGPLLRGADGVAKPVGSGLRVPNPELVAAQHKFGRASFAEWHKYTEPQLAKLDDILSQLVAQFPNLMAIVGADDICPMEQLAPGPALPERFLDITRYR